MSWELLIAIFAVLGCACGLWWADGETWRDPDE